MYRIKNDKRVEASVAKICNGLAECMRNKRFPEIGVAEIAEASGVSRATFYRIFDTPHDVLVYLCDKIVADLIHSHTFDNLSDPDQIGLKTLEYLTSHADEISIVFKSGRLDLLQKALEPFTDKVAPYFALNATEREMDYLKASIAVRYAAILRVWNLHGRVESASDIQAIFRRFNLR